MAYLYKELRQFSANVEELAEACCYQPFTNEIFNPLGTPPKGGGTSAIEVRMETTGRPAYVKPARTQVHNLSDVVNEKLASDLGYMLGLPVSPVQLSRQTAHRTLPPVVAICYPALAQGRHWGDVVAKMTDDKKRLLTPLLSAMWTFHAWIVDTDHDWNDGNALLELGPDGNPRAAFIDYSWSLTRSWKPPSAAPNKDWSAMGGPYADPDRDVMFDIIDRIEKVDLNDLEHIIGRMPDDCLSPPDRAAWAQALFDRRLELRNILKLGAAP